MMQKRVDMYYYSSTGNTLILTDELVKVLRQNGYTVRHHAIEHTDPASVRTDRTIGLAFPVAFQSTFPFIWKFFKGLPGCDGTEIFMLDTMMAFSGAIVGPLKKTLQKKGYSCIGAKEFIMPGNFFPKKINSRKNERIINTSLEKVRMYALELITGRSKWNRVPLVSDLLYLLCCNDFMMKHVCTAPANKITVDTTLCKSCSMCKHLCPAAAITMDTIPLHIGQCQLCMRCMSFCPFGAVSIPGKDCIPYRAVPVKELIKKRE